MEFWTITVVLFIISFLWAWVSLIRENKKPHEVEHVKHELTQGKVLFQKD